MKRNWSYLKYVLRHKWFVLVASRRVGASLWLAIIHDLSKFSRSEWGPYARTFYDVVGGNQRGFIDPGFKAAWEHHKRCNPHHWERWVSFSVGDDNVTRGVVRDMPGKYVREMIADWMGAGRAITGKWEHKEWYEKNKATMSLSENTRKLVEEIIDESK